MSPKLKKITIADLRVGMFIVEMDISWIKSPFLLHRRSIKTKNDILLLKKSGVQVITIDLSKSLIEENISETEKKQAEDSIPEDAPQEDRLSVPMAQTVESINPEKASPQSIDNPSALLEEELTKAIILKEQASEAFQEVNELVKKNQAIPAEKFEPVIDDTISSLLRNSQALLTLMHLQRYEEKLFAHSFSVMSLALTFAIKEGVSAEDMKILGMAALIHDIGWAQLPLNLFGKARKYTDNELKVVHQHQRIANIILGKSSSISERVKQLMMTHHERNDGSGYPGALKAEQLDPLVKILILTDYYDEIIHGLLDRPGVIPSEALRVLYKDAVQNKLDKSQVELLIKLMGIYPLTSAVELSSGEKGIVVEVHRDKPLIPVVKLMYSSDGNALATPVLIDLETDKKKRKVKGIVDFLDKRSDPQNLLVVDKI